jgi:hypothetical protein
LSVEKSYTIVLGPFLHFGKKSQNDKKRRNLNKAVRRNRERFPGDFMFQLTAEETQSLMFQTGTSKKRGGSRHFPYAFTQKGARISTQRRKDARTQRKGAQFKELNFFLCASASLR